MLIRNFLILVAFILLFSICGCATYKAAKIEYEKNKYESTWDDDVGSEFYNVGKGVERDLVSPIVLIENIFWQGRESNKR